MGFLIKYVYNHVDVFAGVIFTAKMIITITTSKRTAEPAIMYNFHFFQQACFSISSAFFSNSFAKSMFKGKVYALFSLLYRQANLEFPYFPLVFLYPH